jgi:hypothetical protein
MDLADWLRGLGLEQYEDAFRDNEIDWKVLPSLTAGDLKEIGVVPVGHRRRLLDAIAALRGGAQLPAPETASAAATVVSGSPLPFPPPLAGEGRVGCTDRIDR